MGQLIGASVWKHFRHLRGPDRVWRRLKHGWHQGFKQAVSHLQSRNKSQGCSGLAPLGFRACAIKVVSSSGSCLFTTPPLFRPSGLNFLAGKTTRSAHAGRVPMSYPFPDPSNPGDADAPARDEDQADPSWPVRTPDQYSGQFRMSRADMFAARLWAWAKTAKRP